MPTNCARVLADIETIPSAFGVSIDDAPDVELRRFRLLLVAPIFV